MVNINLKNAFLGLSKEQFKIFKIKIFIVSYIFIQFLKEINKV